jgi:hypothetical protein
MKVTAGIIFIIITCICGLYDDGTNKKIASYYFLGFLCGVIVSLVYGLDL